MPETISYLSVYSSVSYTLTCLNLSLRHQGAPISLIALSKGPEFPNYTMICVLIKKCRIFKSYNREKTCAKSEYGVSGGGIKGIR